MGTKENMVVAKRLFTDVFTDGQESLLNDLLAKDVVFSDPSNPQVRSGLSDFTRLEEAYREAFPDKRLKIEDLIAADSKVIVRWSFEGTNTGRFEGRSPSGMPVQTTGITILTFKGKKIQEIHQQWDELSFLECLGEAPSSRWAA